MHDPEEVTTGAFEGHEEIQEDWYKYFPAAQLLHTDEEVQVEHPSGHLTQFPESK